ncbi:MAG TPA: PAS domain-containing transcriptional regulator [Burkholderiaceae bacterium]|nr:PAS domain-containing transcriptional regulator [Burkholderiaceae bacterium]
MESFYYKLQKFDPGVVTLDADNRIAGMNAVAFRVLGDIQGDPIGREVLQFHPEKSRDKIQLLLDAADKAARCPMDSPPPMTMMISIPDRVLLIKVTKLMGRDSPVGSCLVFYDLTDITTQAENFDDLPEPSSRPRQLVKLPVLLHNRVLLLSLDEVVWMQSEAHYTTVHTRDQQYFCNLSLGDLEERLDQNMFLRTHRSYFINLRHAKTIEREGETYIVVMDGHKSARVPVGRSRIWALKEALGLGRPPFGRSGPSEARPPMQINAGEKASVTG